MTYQELSRSTWSNSRPRSTMMCFQRAVWWRDKLIQIWLWIILRSRAGNMAAYARLMSPHPLVTTLCAVCNAAGAKTRWYSDLLSFGGYFPGFKLANVFVSKRKISLHMSSMQLGMCIEYWKRCRNGSSSVRTT